MDRHTIQGGPCLIYNVKAHSARDFVDIRVIDFVHKADRGRLEGVVLREVDPHLPYSALVRR